MYLRSGDSETGKDIWLTQFFRDIIHDLNVIMTWRRIPYTSVASNATLSFIIISPDTGIGHSGLAWLTADEIANMLNTKNNMAIESGAKPNSNLPILIILSKFKIILSFLLRKALD